jgi:hypothetical protein
LLPRIILDRDEETGKLVTWKTTVANYLETFRRLDTADKEIERLAKTLEAAAAALKEHRRIRLVSSTSGQPPASSADGQTLDLDVSVWPDAEAVERAASARRQALDDTRSAFRALRGEMKVGLLPPPES